MRYEFVSVKFKQYKLEKVWKEYEGENYRDIIRRMSLDGWTYKGWVPTDFSNYGLITAMDFIFERED